MTPRQAEVMANLTRVTTDGSRHAPMFWLGDRNVSVQVRSLLAGGRIALRDGRLVEAKTSVASPPSSRDTDAAVRAMRELLAGADSNLAAVAARSTTRKARSP